jgi:hypothetical protein
MSDKKSMAEHVDNLYLTIEGLSARNAMLWKALRFYSVESNYFGVGGGAGAPEMTTAPIMRDLGRSARFVLDDDDKEFYAEDGGRLTDSEKEAADMEEAEIGYAQFKAMCEAFDDGS